MTRLPLPDQTIVRPYDAEPYEPNAVCAAPGCDQPSQDPHHLWRRSFLGGAYDWVQVENFAIGNVLGLCRHHHDQVEAGSAWITLEPRRNGVGTAFCWTSLLTPTEPLLWQPPVIGPLDEEGVGTRGDEAGVPEPPVASLAVPRNGEGEKNPALPSSTVDVPSSSNGPTWLGEPTYMEPDDTLIVENPPHDPTVCPSCKRPLPQPKIEREMEPARPRRTWSVTVPMDQRENGAAILDELLVAAREGMAERGLPYGAEETVKFNVLAGALALFVQHIHLLVTTEG